MSAKDALRNYYSRMHKRESNELKPRRKNKRPERDVELSLRPMFNKLGLDMHKIESKAVYNAHLGRYLNGQAEAGISDYIGNSADGLACYIEVKAAGRRATLKEHQRAFLEDKIKQGCFAVCVDSPDLLMQLWEGWIFQRNAGHGINFLLRSLPTVKAKPDFIIE